MPGSGLLTLTGQQGEVMQESVRAALAWIRSNADQLRSDALVEGEWALGGQELPSRINAIAVARSTRAGLESGLDQVNGIDGQGTAGAGDATNADVHCDVR